MESLFASWKDSSKKFLISGSLEITYGKFFDDLAKSRSLLRNKYTNSEIFALEALNNYSTYLKFISLILEKHIVFLVPSYQFNDPQYFDFLETETQSTYIKIAASDELTDTQTKSSSENSLILAELNSGHAAFIVRTSGTSGKKFKFILHNPLLFIKKYKQVKNQYKSILTFFPVDSIAGIETLLETITHSSQLINASDKITPQHISELIEAHQVDFFHTTPSFLNLMLIAGCFSKYNLSPLKKLAYGSETMTPPTLEKIQKLCPHIEFIHKYGMSEIGVLATITNPNACTTFKLDEQINQSRVVDNMLEIKSSTQCHGYLNHQITDEGPWFKTNDAVEISTDGYMKIIGRSDDLINVSGKKFYPSEVEDLLIQIEGVEDIVVRSSAHEIIGNVIIAHFYLGPQVNEDEFRKAFKIYCETHVPAYMCPQKIVILNAPPINSRFKKSRLL